MPLEKRGLVFLLGLPRVLRGQCLLHNLGGNSGLLGIVLSQVTNKNVGIKTCQRVCARFLIALSISSRVTGVPGIEIIPLRLVTGAVTADT